MTNDNPKALPGSYLVTWSIDIEETADNPNEAAVQAMLILVQHDLELYERLTAGPDSPTVFEVYDEHGTCTTLDLTSYEDED